MIALSAEQLARMSRLLDEALPLDVEGRSRWLESLASEHRDLAAALREALLPSHRQEGDAVALATLPKLDIEDQPPSAGAIGPGEHVGPYQLVRQLGAGGMAEVWLAQRADGAFKRQVALKLPVLARLRKDLAERFARERDILAELEHPNIARLYDAGISPDGLPYLAMEYVAGQPLTDWCDAHRLGVQERLKLYLQVLDAVQYAHARHVLHRDIKPSNIMVTDSGQVRLLDFGVAKLLADDDTDSRLTQLYGQALTPEYASPELLQGEPVGAASDIYSLGVVLCEVLAGSRPYRLKPGASRTLLEQAVAEARVLRPSAQLTEQAARVRAATPETLARRLRGDLDAIVLKALSKRPADRYPGAAALADDVRRHLEGRPVQARRGRLAYRIGKFAGRHPAAAVASLAGITLLAIAFTYLVTRPAFAPDSASAGRPVVAPPGPKAEAPPESKSIAVLPFVDMSEKRDQEYFSDGLSEELIDRLSRLRDLRVIARTSSFQFKNRSEDVRAIAGRLGVDYILEGSVRKSGPTVRVTAQLIRASDGSHLWSRTYGRGMSDIFKVQDDIAGTVARELNVALNEADTSSQPRESNADAYNLYLQGQYFAERNTRQDAEKAVGLYRAATRLDPGYALAWARLANISRHQASIGWVAPAAGTARAREAVDQALRIDPGFGYAHRVLGNLLEESEWNWTQAAAEYQRALELDRNDLQARIALADLKAIRLGQFDERIRYSRQLLARDPLDTDERWSVGWMLMCAGRFEESETTLRKLVELNPTFAGGPAFLGLTLLLTNRGPEALATVEKESDESFRLSVLPAIYWSLGRRRESDAALHELERKYAAGSTFNIAEMHAWRGETGAALTWLERAYRQRDPGMEMLRIDPLLRDLRGESAFGALLARMNLTD